VLPLKFGRTCFGPHWTFAWSFGAFVASQPAARSSKRSAWKTWPSQAGVSFGLKRVRKTWDATVWMVDSDAAAGALNEFARFTTSATAFCTSLASDLASSALSNEPPPMCAVACRMLRAAGWVTPKLTALVTTV
jgi:hypothetical protein